MLFRSPASARFDGRSLAPVLRDPKQTVGDRMMVVQYGQIPKKWESCVIWGKWRLVSGEELYDIKADPGQEKDVGPDNRDVRRKMRDYYESWWAVVEPKLQDLQTSHWSKPWVA